MRRMMCRHDVHVLRQPLKRLKGSFGLRLGWVSRGWIKFDWFSGGAHFYCTLLCSFYDPAVVNSFEWKNLRGEI